MRTIISLAALTAAGLIGSPAAAQNADSITLYEYPAFFGRSVTITAATPNLEAQAFAKKARSARVVGSWTVCREASYAGTCTTLTADQQTLFLVGLDRAIASLKPTNAAAAPATGTSAAASASTAATAGVAGTSASAGVTASAKVDLATLDVEPGKRGQDTEFYPAPTLSKAQVSAGTNDQAAGDAFCKLAGYTGAAYSSRARVQASGLVDLTSSTKVRAFALRDVLCRR